MKIQFSVFLCCALPLFLLSCNQPQRVDESGRVKMELYDRKIRRITQDMFVSETLALGDSINRDIIKNAPDLATFQSHADSITQYSGFRVGVYTSETNLPGTARERELYASAIGAWRNHQPVMPLAQKLGDTAWMYVGPAVRISKGKRDTLGITGVMFPLKLLIREMNIKGVG